MTDLQYRDRPRRSGPTPWQVLGPAVAAVVLLLLVALAVRPGSFVVSIGSGADPQALPSVAPSALTPGGQAAPPRAVPVQPSPDPASDALAALEEILLRRDVAVSSQDAVAWTETSADPSDAEVPNGSFTVLTSLPLTRFESSALPSTLRPVADPVAGEGWQATVETLYALAGATPVVRTDEVLLAAPSARLGWQVVAWNPDPSTSEVGTSAPWDLGEVHTVVGDRGVVLSWADPTTLDNGSIPPQRVEEAQRWGGQVSDWVDRGAVVVDSYLGTAWPRTTLVLAPATTEQYDALVPGPVPDRPDVFAAVTTDVRTPEGGGDLVVLNPTAQVELVEETWQVTVTHKLVHVASGARYGDGQEIWLAEGLADLVGWSSLVPVTVGREDVAARLLERVAGGTADIQDLPDADDFAASDADVVGDAYEGAWLAALLLQDELGLDALLAVYEDASDGPGSPGERADAALRAATGQGRDAFRDRWAAYLSSLATP